MSLRGQVVLGIVGMSIVVVILLFGVVSPRLGGTFRGIERAEVEKNIGRARSAVSAELANLDSLSHDWAAWDEPAEFIRGSLPTFPEENVTEDAFTNLRLNFMVFFDSAHRVAYAQDHGLESLEAPSYAEFLTAVGPALALWSSTSDTASRAGVMAVGDSLVLVAIHPILSSLHEAPAVGLLAVGRVVDADEAQRLASQIALPLLFRRMDDPRTPPDVLAAVTGGDSSDLSSAIVPLSATAVAGYSAWRGLLGAPVAILSVEVPRDTYRTGMAASGYLMLALLVALGVCGGGFLLFLDARVLRPTGRLTRDVARIAREQDASQRVPAKGKDELARLGTNINSMLASIEESRGALARSEQHYHNLFESSRDPIYITAEDGRFIDVNQALLDLLGYSREEITTMTAGEFYVKPEDREAFQTAIGEKGFVTSFPVTLRRKDGAHLRCLLTTTLEAGSGNRGRTYQGIIRDVTELLRQQEKLTFLATHDPLTGLLTRGALDDVLRLEIARAMRNLDRLAVFYLDLDKFKEVNDIHGHAAGDRVLQEVGARLRDVLRASDTIARLGGDEFVALLPGIDSPRDAEAAADKILQALRGSFEIPDDGRLGLSASIGIALFPDDGETAAHLLRKADAAMYIAKNHGRNGWKRFEGGPASPSQS